MENHETHETGITEEPGVERQVDVGSPPEDVWELLVDDDERSAWFGGDTTLEPVPGGTARFEDDDGSVRSATVDDVVVHRRLSWTWRPEEGGETVTGRVRIDLTPIPGGTRISVTETLAGGGARALALAGGHDRLVDLELRVMLRGPGLAVLAGR